MKHALLAAGGIGLLCGCVSSHPDHFYILTPLPPGAAAARTATASRVTLRVKLPSWLDRREMVLNTSAQGVSILEHERWAAPLADLVNQALARDLEQRRPDWLVADSNVARSGSIVTVAVNVVGLTIRPGNQASIQAQWRVTDASGNDMVGQGEFAAPLAADDYPAVAKALSEDVASMADEITGRVTGGR